MLLIILFMGIQPVMSSNVAPALSDPKLIEQTDLERETIFASLIDDPTNSVSYTHLTLPTILLV